MPPPPSRDFFPGSLGVSDQYHQRPPDRAALPQLTDHSLTHPGPALAPAGQWQLHGRCARRPARDSATITGTAVEPGATPSALPVGALNADYRLGVDRRGHACRRTPPSRDLHTPIRPGALMPPSAAATTDSTQPAPQAIGAAPAVPVPALREGGRP